MFLDVEFTPVISGRQQGYRLGGGEARARSEKDAAQASRAQGAPRSGRSSAWSNDPEKRDSRQLDTSRNQVRCKSDESRTREAFA